MGKHISRGGQLKCTRFQASSHARLDRIFLSVTLAKNTSSYDEEPVFFNAHCPLTTAIAFTLGASKKIDSFDWRLQKCHAKLLIDDLFNQAVSDIFTHTGNELWSTFFGWDEIKQPVELAAIERASILQFQTRALEKTLLLNLKELRQTEFEFPGNCTDNISSIKKQLNCLHRDQHQSEAVRSRAQKKLLGEQPTKRALAAENKYALNKKTASIEYGDETTAYVEKTGRVFFNYYRELFGTRNGTRQAMGMQGLWTHLPHLPGIQTCILEEQISLDEIETAVNSLPAYKSHGPHGISAEFYKEYKSKICPMLLKHIRHAYQAGGFPPSFLQSHRIIIPKTNDTDKLRQVTGYRPVQAMLTIKYS